MAIETEGCGHVTETLEERTDAIDATWRAHTLAGNEAFAAGHAERARSSYESAVTEAERLLRLAERSSLPATLHLAPTLLVIGAQNLAELERRARSFERASELLRTSFERIVAVAASEDAPLALRTACVRNFMPAISEIAEDLVARGRSAELQPLLERANAARHAVSVASSNTPTS